MNQVTKEEAIRQALWVENFVADALPTLPPDPITLETRRLMKEYPVALTFYGGEPYMFFRNGLAAGKAADILNSTFSGGRSSVYMQDTKELSASGLARLS